MKQVFNAAAVVLAFALLLNQWQLTVLHKHVQNAQASPTLPTGQAGGTQAAGSSAPGVPPAGAVASALQELVARGVPAVYGAELDVSFDDAAAAIAVLSRYEQDTRPDKLTGEALERYIDIGSRISCEFCCSARTMVFPDGRKACACAHSAAMRGVSAYLLTKYPNMSNQEVYNEVAKWKSAFFPGPTVQKALAGQAGGQAGQGLPPQVGGC